MLPELRSLDSWEGWACRTCGTFYETPAHVVPETRVCSECRDRESQVYDRRTLVCSSSEVENSLPDHLGGNAPLSVRCTGQWHVFDDGAHGTAYQPCPHAARRRAADAARADRASQRRRYSGREKSFSMFERRREPAAFDAAVEFSKVPCGGLVLCRASEAGPANVGAGKTHLLMACRTQLLLAGFRVVWIDRKTLGAHVLATHSLAVSSPEARKTSEEYEMWVCADVIIIDDLGQEGAPPEKVASILNPLLDDRGDKPFTVSSNLTSRQIEQRYGAALHSRIFGPATVPHLNGEDFRPRVSRSAS